MMAFGQDWLTKWEDEQEERMVERISPPKIAPSSVDVAKEIILAELSEILNAGYARQIADRIASRVATAIGKDSARVETPHKT